MHLRPPALEVRFELRRELGRGGMGVVYEALDRERGGLVAVKTLASLDDESRIRFKREFRALQGLHHPNLVRLGELVEDGGHLCFSMELVDGVDFLRWVRPQDRSKTPLHPSQTDTVAPSSSVSDDWAL